MDDVLRLETKMALYHATAEHTVYDAHWATQVIAWEWATAKQALSTYHLNTNH